MNKTEEWNPVMERKIEAVSHQNLEILKELQKTAKIVTRLIFFQPTPS
jgi:hypothetical protein